MDHQKIGVISATEFEMTPFAEKLTEVSISKKAMLSFHDGMYGDIPIVAGFSGICKVNPTIAAQILISEFDVKRIIMIGVAGAMQDSLNMLDTVIADKVTYHDYAGRILTRYHPHLEQPFFEADADMLHGILCANADDRTIHVGKIVTGEVFIQTEGREEIIRNHNPLCVDMETASVAQVCYVNQIPFAAIRSISDTPKESGYNAFIKYAVAAAEKSVQVLEKYLKSDIMHKNTN